MSLKITPLYFFSSNITYFGHTKLIKTHFFFRLSSARVKICQIPHVSFKTASQPLFNFVSFFIIMTHNSSVNFKLIHFLLWTKGSHESPNFDTLKYSGLMSFSKPQVGFPSNSASLFNIMKDNSSLLFTSNNIYFAQKEPIKVNIFDTIECSCQNLSNSLCQL